MLKMNDEQRYSAVLKELGEVLQEKNTTINCQLWQIETLKEKLEAAERERDAAVKECIFAKKERDAAAKECEFAKDKLADAGIKIATLLEEVEQLKGGAA